MESISPNLYVHNLQETVDFYRLLGFELITTVPEKEPVFALMVNGQVTFMFQTFTSIEGTLPLVSRQTGGSLLLYIKVNNIRQFFEEIKDKVTVLQGLETTFYGATEFLISDNNNFVLTFAEDE